MELQSTFSRRVGAGTVPLLGSDTVPTGLPAVDSALDARGNILRSVRSKVLGDPVQRVWMFYTYAGAGVAPTVPLDAYAYVRDTDSWIHLGSQVLLTTSQAGYVDLPALVKAAVSVSRMTEEAANSLEVVLIPGLPVGAPDGTYTFGAAFDIGVSPGDEATAAAAILAELVAIHGHVDDLNLEATQLKVLWGQSGSTAPTATADVDGVKTTAATPIVASVYAGAALNGVGMAAGALVAPRNVSVTTAVHAATYKVGAPNAIVVTGTDYYTGLPVSEALLLTNANGGETITGSVLFAAAALSIDVPGQNDALGAFEFGTGTFVPGTQKAVVRGGGQACSASPARYLRHANVGEPASARFGPVPKRGAHTPAAWSAIR